MSRALIVHRAGAGLTIQDQGRPGYLAFGLSRGGAADKLALAEGAALLGQSDTHAALEMALAGGEFEATEDMRIALSGAPMGARIDGAPVAWNACHLLPAGIRLTIGAADRGSYGYLHVGGGLATEMQLGARSAHIGAGLGGIVEAGARLPVGVDGKPGNTGHFLPADSRFEGGKIRIVPSLQTDMFPEDERQRFEDTAFTRDARGNRMGVRLAFDGSGFSSEAGLSVLSDIVIPGDIQVTGDGTPFVLLAECQTTGGYPRIGTVLPTDLPRVVQARPGNPLRFQFITLEEAVAVETRERARRAGLRRALQPLVRDPHDIHDLLSYQLISGVIAGDEE